MILVKSSELPTLQDTKGVLSEGKLLWFLLLSGKARLEHPNLVNCATSLHDA